MIFLMSVGCVPDVVPGLNRIKLYDHPPVPDGAEQLDMIPTIDIVHVPAFKPAPHFIMSHSKYGIAPTPECWESSLELFKLQNSNNQEMTSVAKCRQMSQNTMKILILLVANCQHIDIGEPLYVDEATAELCNKSLDESNLSTCLGGLSQLGKRTYLMYTTHIYSVCYRLSEDALVKYQRDTQRDISARYTELVKHSIQSHKELDQHMQEHHRELQDLSLIVHKVENSMKEQLTNRIENVDKKRSNKLFEDIPVSENLKTTWNMMSEIIYWVMLNGEGLNPMRLFGLQWNFITPEFDFGWKILFSFDIAVFFLFAIFRWMLGKIMTGFFPSTSFQNVLKWFFILQVFVEAVQYISVKYNIMLYETRNQYVWQLRICSICGDIMIGCFYLFVQPLLKALQFVFNFLKGFYKFFFNKIRPNQPVKKSAPTKRVGNKIEDFNKNKLSKISPKKPDSFNWIAGSFDDVSDIQLQDWDKSTKSHADKKKKYPVYRKR
jgi:hypothetical protein